MARSRYKPPSDVITGFRSFIKDAEARHDELLLAVYGKKRQSILESTLAEQFALTVTIRWESFLHDLLIAHILEDPTTFVDAYIKRIRQGVLDKYGSGWQRRVRIDGSHTQLTAASVELLLDPRGRNLTVASSSELANTASNLIGSAAKNFSLKPEDRQLLDFSIALRNYLAHRSSSSRSELVAAIGAFSSSGPMSCLAGPFTTAGSYLRQSCASGTRMKFLFASLSGLAAKLTRNTGATKTS